MTINKIQILMATYNGEKYLEEQLDSILNQTYINWELLIRDDCSTDKTLEILNTYSNKYPEKIFIIKDNLNKLGACYNFLNLVKLSTSDYIMFSDQDDFWLENKIELTLNKMLIEEKNNLNIPISIHTDLKVVDYKKETIHNSYYKSINLSPSKQNKLGQILIHSSGAGCTMMINKKLRDFIVKYPNKGVFMHDLWVTLLVNIFGKSFFINEQTILYRIHENNTIGISKNDKFNKNFFIFLLNFKEKRKLFLKDSKMKHEQVKLILDSFDNIDNKKKIILINFANFYNYNFIKKRILMLKHCFFTQSLIINIRNFIYY
ncbi:MAG: glycosyltransferase family 2 protein [Cyanobacteriota bacterium]